MYVAQIAAIPEKDLPKDAPVKMTPLSAPLLIKAQAEALLNAEHMGFGSQVTLLSLRTQTAYTFEKREGLPT